MSWEEKRKEKALSPLTPTLTLTPLYTNYSLSFSIPPPRSLSLSLTPFSKLLHKPHSQSVLPQKTESVSKNRESRRNGEIHEES